VDPGTRGALTQHVPGEEDTPGGSGIHGHDLALGSGSVDGIVGASLFWSWRRAFLRASGQYAVRREGRFDYRYANDLIWSCGPGAYLALRHDRTLALHAAFSGETKGKDTLAGTRLDDTAITSLYLGPGVSIAWRGLAAELAAELPLRQNNTSLQIVPSFRLRGGLVWHF
jgi:hypothetical protein